MKTKNIFVIFSLFMILMCCVSAISAASDDIVNNAASEIGSGEESISNSNDEQAIGVDSTKHASIAEKNDNKISDEGELASSGEDSALYKGQTDKRKLASTGEDSVLSKGKTDEVLSVVYSSYNLYSIELESSYQFSSYKKANIKVNVTPPPSYMPEYSFMLFVVDSKNNIVYNSSLFTGRSTSKTFTIPAKTLLPGIYKLYAYNGYDQKLMATSFLGVKGDAVITANDFNGYYMSNSKMTAKITDNVTGKPLTSLLVHAVFTNGKTTVTKDYLPDSNGQISFEPPVGVGTWSVTFTPFYSGITGATVKNVIVKKSAVSINSYKVIEYKGYKTTLKAVVKSNGRNVNEGTVTFKINGKTYKVAVKDGVATKKIKLTKIKAYAYSAKYDGDANLAASKTVKAKAYLKKPFKTKIILKNQVVYSGKSKTTTLLVKTTNGKKVKNGKIKIVSGGKTSYANVKNGKVKVVTQGLPIMTHFVGFTKSGETYKKSIVKKAKIRYIPTSHKYKASRKTVKITSKFKCTCGRTTTHYHTAWNGYYFYKYRINIR